MGFELFPFKVRFLSLGTTDILFMGGLPCALWDVYLHPPTYSFYAGVIPSVVTTKNVYRLPDIPSPGKMVLVRTNVYEIIRVLGSDSFQKPEATMSYPRETPCGCFVPSPRISQSMVVWESEGISFQKAPPEKVQAPLAVLTRGAGLNPAAGPAVKEGRLTEGLT